MMMVNQMWKRRMRTWDGRRRYQPGGPENPTPVEREAWYISCQEHAAQDSPLFFRVWYAVSYVSFTFQPLYHISLTTGLYQCPTLTNSRRAE